MVDGGGGGGTTYPGLQEVAKQLPTIEEPEKLPSLRI